MCDNNNTQSIADYLAQLLKDKKQLAAFPNVFLHLERLLDDGRFFILFLKCVKTVFIIFDSLYRASIFGPFLNTMRCEKFVELNVFRYLIIYYMLRDWLLNYECALPKILINV